MTCFFALKINVGHSDLHLMVLWFCFISWRIVYVWTSSFGIMGPFDLKCRSLWLVFHGPLILPYILKTIWFTYIILWYYESVWPEFWPQNKCRSLWPIFFGPVILTYILKTICCMSIIIWDYDSVWSDVWPQNKCRSVDLYFMVQWFCLITWRLFDVCTSFFGIMGQYDLTFDLKVNVGHCDLYCMVQWFCLISWRLFDV